MMGNSVTNRVNEPAVAIAREEPDKFMKLSIKVVEKFLQTVVFIDDEAVFDDNPVKSISVKPTKKITVQDTNSNTQSNEKNENHSLNVKTIMDSFTPKGMVCAVLKPDKEKSVLNIIEGAVKKADVLVLDWQINSDNGEKAIEIINQLVSFDSQNVGDNQRLRLIIIYSGVEPIKVFEQMKVKLPSFTPNEESNTFRLGHLSISIIYKHAVSEDKLPEWIYREFARMTAGIISNVAIEAMSVLRDNTHLLLGKVGPDMDPSYLAHRVLLPIPDDAKNHAVEIITSEIDSILEDYRVGDVADSEAVNSWLVYKNICTIPSRIKVTNGEEKEITRDNINEWQTKGIEKSSWCSSIPKEKRNEFKNTVHDNLTQIFCETGKTGNELDCKLAILTSQKCIYKKGCMPTLTFGTIIREYNTDSPNGLGHYWLCIQPKCNCVRIDPDRDFSFLKLSTVRRDESFNLVIKDNNNYIKLKVNYNIFESKLLKFSANPIKKEVIAEEINNKITFIDSNRLTYKWVSELKTEQIQRIANIFGSTISRVGLNESEWLRRSASNKLDSDM